MQCPGFEANTTFFFFSSAEYIPRLLYYSHIPAIFFSLFLGFFVVSRARGALLGKLFLAVCVSFSVWAFLDMASWVTSESTTLSFVWAFFDITYTLIFIFSFYFFSVFISGRDILPRLKLVLAILFLPVLISILSGSNEAYFDLKTCIIKDNIYSTGYVYLLSYIFILWILILAIVKYRKSDKNAKKTLLIFTFGVESFLIILAFFDSFSTLSADLGIDETYKLSPYATLGMPIFISSIAYLMARCKIFGIKLHEGQAIIVGLFILIGSQLFYVNNSLDRILTIVTLIITIIFGLYLIRSIKQEERKKREELERVNKELLKLDQAKSEFINIASHQLRTPVSVIKGVTSLIISGKMDQFSQEEKSQFYQSIWNKSKRLEEIIKDILNAASLTNRKYLVSQEKAEEVDVRDLVSQIVDDFQAESKRQEINLTFQIKGDGPFVVKGIKEDLREMINNLVSNALKYTSSVKEGRIEIILQKDDGDILLSVKDNGIGIPKEETPNLFQKFYRASNAKSVYADGSGLGLFIVKEIVSGHGGKVWVKSELGQGATFFVSLPA